MLLSMTGFGESSQRNDHLSLRVEIRAVNNRYFKLSVRGPEPYPLLETEIEKVVRRFVKRGTLLIQIRAERQAKASDFRINPIALRSYLEQVAAVCSKLGIRDPMPNLAGQVLALPGVVPETETAGAADDEWPILEQTLTAALENLQQMRRREGRAMADELLGYRTRIADELERIGERIPSIILGYSNRLRERVQQLVADAKIEISPADLVREVALFAERGDVAEEITRLAGHLDQFAEVIAKETDSPGRKLEFITQEMGRETNTIGSKANDNAVSRHVVEIKAVLEKIRELVQNVE